MVNTNAEELAMALKSIKEATNIMSEDSTPTLSIITPLYAQLLHDTEAGFCGNDAPITQENKQAIHENLAKRYTSVAEKNILLTASTPDLKNCLSSPKMNNKTYTPSLLLRLQNLR